MGLIDSPYLDAIKGFEGYSPNAAWDYKQSSSGYGTKAQPGDENIPPDQLRAIHEQRFQEEIARAADHVDNINPNLPPGVKAALTSLTYNAGPGWSQSGLGDLVRAGNLQAAQAKLQEYNKAGGEVNPGLVARRAKEAAWFGGALPQGQPQTAAASPAMAALPPQTARVASAIMGTPQVAPSATQTAGDVANQIMGVPAQAGFDLQPMQAPPILAVPRKQIDLSKLRAAFGQPFSYGTKA